MSGIVSLYLKREVRSNYLYYLRQVLYLIPVLAIILMISSTQNIKYTNQYIFLNNTSYQSISTGSDVKDKDNTFKVYEGKIAVVEDVRGVSVYKKQYNCSVFGMTKVNYDFEHTYFTKDNMEEMGKEGKGGEEIDLECIDLDSLDSDEIAISYDVAKRLDVHKGDTVTFISTGSNLQQEYSVKGIFKTKYTYEMIGASGTVVIKDNKSLEEMYEYDYYHFSQDKDGSISKDVELRECNFLRLPTMSVIMVNLVFPLIGIILLVVLLYREIRHLVSKMTYDFAVLTVCGIKLEHINRLIFILEGIVGMVASIGTLIVYKCLVMEKLIGEYVSFRICILYFVVINIIIALIIKINAGLLSDKIDRKTILNTLQKRGDSYE